MTQQLTPTWALPYYQATDAADGATQQQALATKLDGLLTKKIRTGSTWAVQGALTAGQVIPPFFAPVGVGQVANIVGVRAKLASGTSIVVQLTRNGANVGTAVTVTPTKASTAFTAILMVDGDEIGIVLSSPVATPTTLSVTVIFEHTV